MASVSETPPPLTPTDLHAVRTARAVVDRSLAAGPAVSVDVEYLDALLIAYDKVAARLAWLAAEHTECDQ